MIWTEEENMARALNNMISHKGKSCQNCQWGMYEKGDEFVVCGHHIDNFRVDSFCSYWTDSKDPNFLKWKQKRREELREKLKEFKLRSK